MISMDLMYSLGPLGEDAEQVVEFVAPDMFEKPCSLVTDSAGLFMTDRGNEPNDNPAGLR